MPANKDLFKKYINTILIETGSYRGDGIKAALDAGFSHVFSIELSPELHYLCEDRFYGNRNVTLILGDSAVELDKLLTWINRPTTFWLDGHYSGDDTAKGDTEYPLMKELDAIKNHRRDDFIIMVDDLRCWSVPVCGFDTKVIEERCLDINPKYKFTLEDGFVPNDILVAHL